MNSDWPFYVQKPKEKKRSFISRFQKEAPAQPKPQVVLLLALWGEQYISNFLSLSIRSLLAPGNIPALSEEYECTFMFLTHPSDEGCFRENPAFSLLTQYCNVEFVDISDLIFDGNYSTTLTLSYDRGMKLLGDEMCDTYFIYLVADYIMADGSLRGMMKYMRTGVSGITTGNFQIVEEESASYLYKMIDPETGALSVNPRDLLRFGFQHMHSVTTANTVTQELFHNTHTNRLFWHSEPDYMVGRFYLRHMLCIKPEVSDYEVGSSCDYSFIPELCPSGNVAHIGDSDEYLVVELQPRLHEAGFMRSGPQRQKALAEHLSEWTTKEHRENVHYPVIFHTSDIDDRVRRLVAESETYVQAVEKLLAPTPQSHRGHPYWLGAMHAAMPYLKKRNKDNDLWRLQVEYFEDELTTPSVQRVRQAYYRFFGKVPNIYPWHPRWVDYAPFKETMQRVISSTKEPVLVLVDAPNLLVNWLADNYGEKIDVHQIDHFQQRMKLKKLPSPQAEDKPLAKYGLIVILIANTSSIRKLNHLLPLIGRKQTTGKDTCLWIFNERSPVNNESVQHALAFVAHHLTSPRMQMRQSYYVCGYMRGITKFSTEGIFRVLRRMRCNWQSALFSLLLAPVFALVLVQNLLYRRCYKKRYPQGHVSSMFIRYTLRDLPQAEVQAIAAPADKRDSTDQAA